MNLPLYEIAWRISCFGLKEGHLPHGNGTWAWMINFMRKHSNTMEPILITLFDAAFGCEENWRSVANARGTYTSIFFSDTLCPEQADS